LLIIKSQPEFKKKHLRETAMKKMRKYAPIAIAVVDEYCNRECSAVFDFEESWKRNSIKIYGKEVKKDCPGLAFIGLCELGYIVGIPKGKYNGAGYKNTQYAIATIKLICSGEAQQFKTKKEFWEHIGIYSGLKDPAQNDKGTRAMVEDLHDAGYLNHEKCRELLSCYKLEKMPISH
jgi:hypothetical protein